MDLFLTEFFPMFRTIPVTLHVRPIVLPYNGSNRHEQHNQGDDKSMLVPVDTLLSIGRTMAVVEIEFEPLSSSWSGRHIPASVVRCDLAKWTITKSSLIEYLTNDSTTSTLYLLESGRNVLCMAV